jgi:hypothetical protein
VYVDFRSAWARDGVRVPPISGKIQEVFALSLAFIKPSEGLLKMGRNSVPAALEDLLALTLLSAPEDVVEIRRRESFKS